MNRFNMDNITVKMEPEGEYETCLCEDDNARYVKVEPSIPFTIEPDIISETAVRFHVPDICAIEMRPVPLDIPAQTNPTRSMDAQIKRFKCDICNKEFKMTGQLMRHSRIHRKKEVTKPKHKTSRDRLKAPRPKNKTAVKSFKCDACGKMFKSTGQLAFHYRVHSKVKEKASKNSVKATKPKHKTCKDLLESPRSKHNKSTVKNFKCDMCGKEFKSAAHLTRHIRVHSGERPFKCDICEKAFKDSSGLTRHKRIHSSEKPFKCYICKKTFIQSKDLKNHQRIHSGERPYQCETCEKSFSSLSYLTVHLRTHSGERPYSCAVCHKSFHASNTLARHQRVHTGVKPYKCNQCQKAFTRLATLKHHQKNPCEQIEFDCQDPPRKSQRGKAKKPKMTVALTDSVRFKSD